MTSKPFYILLMNPKINVKYPLLVIPSYIDTVKGKPITNMRRAVHLQ